MPVGTNSMEQRTSPCPNRIFDDLGSAFAMGCLGGSAWHGFKGWRNAPRGDRMRGGYQQIVLRAPALGGNFAVWGGLFATFDCSITAIRQKEDPINAITAGAATGGILAARAGLKAAGTNALVGGALLGLIEGLGFLMGRVGGGDPHTAAPPAPGMSLGVNMPFFGASTSAPRNPLALAQPRRNEGSALSSGSSDDTAEWMSLEDEDTSRFNSTAATLSDESQRAASAAPKLGDAASGARFLPATGRFVKKPVYTAAADFSSEDYTFDDSEDFTD